MRGPNPLHYAQMGKKSGIILTFVLAGCVSHSALEPPLVANVSAEGEACRVTVDGRRVSQKELLDIARSSPGRRGIIVFAVNTPYKCIGAAIITIQEAGVQSVDAAPWNGS